MNTPLIAPGTKFEDLPVLEVPCCFGKSCGLTTIYPDFHWEGTIPSKPARPVFSYRRMSNDDVHPYIQTETVEDLITEINDWAARNAEYL